MGIDWKLAVAIAAIVISLLKDVVVGAFLLLVKFNDLKHLELDVKKLMKITEEDGNKTRKVLENYGKELVKINTRCSERHNRKS